MLETEIATQVRINSSQFTNYVDHLPTYYYQFGCGILKMVGPKK